MKKLFLYVLLTAVAWGGSSCASVKKAPEVQPMKLTEFSAESEKSGFDAASRFADGFASAVKSGDFSAWQKEMPPHIRSKVSAAEFKRMRGELHSLFGNMSSARYLGTLRKGDLRDHLWAVSFEKDGKVNEVVYLVRVYCSENGLPEISGFGVRRF